MPRLLRDWTEDLPLRQQAVLVAAVRGCDGAPKDDPSKPVLWAIRWDFMNPSGGNTNPRSTRTFMGYWDDNLNPYIVTWITQLDQYPFHFVMHVLHAIEILGYKHPDLEVRGRWLGVYHILVRDYLHCNPETEAELDERLADR